MTAEAPPKDFDEILRRLPDREKRHAARDIIAAARPFASWRIGQVLGNGAKKLSAVDRLEAARKEDLFALAYKERDRAKKQAIINTLFEYLQIDIKHIEEEVRKAGGEDLTVRMHNATKDIGDGDRALRIKAEVIWDWFGERGGKFFYDVERQKALLFFNSEIHEVASTDTLLMGRLWALAGLNETQRGTNFILAEFRQRTTAEGARVHQHSWSHTSKTDRAVWLNLAAEDGSIIKISDGQVTTMPNGVNEDEILLARPLFMRPFTYHADASNDQAALEKLGQLVVSNIAADHTDALFTVCWALTSLLLGFTSLRPIVHFQGPKGSGKTGAAKLLWTLLYGSEEFQGKFTLASLAAAASQAPYVVIDDLTSADMNNSLMRGLKTMATGSGSAKRSHGTEMGITTAAASTLIGLTGILPFEAPDLRERIFSIDISRKHQGQEWMESATMMEIIEWRDRIFSAILRVMAQGVVGRYEEQKTIVMWLKRRFPGWAKERMDEFFAMMILFSLRIAGPAGYDPSGEKVARHIFGNSTGAVWQANAMLPVEKTELCLVGKFIKQQDKMSKEFDAESSQVLHWMQSLQTHFAEITAGKGEGETMTDQESRLSFILHRQQHMGRDFVFAVVRTPGAQLLNGIRKFARERGAAQGSIPWDSTMAFSKSVQAELEALESVGIFVKYNGQKDSRSARVNTYAFIVREADEAAKEPQELKLDFSGMGGQQ